MNNLIDSVLSMTLDVYRQFDTQNEDTGAILKEWHYYKSVSCHAKGVIGNSSTSGSGDKQVFGNRYTNDQTIQVRTAERLTTQANGAAEFTPFLHTLSSLRKLLHLQSSW